MFERIERREDWSRKLVSNENGRVLRRLVEGLLHRGMGLVELWAGRPVTRWVKTGRALPFLREEIR